MATSLWIVIRPGTNLGFLPEWLDVLDPTPATEQFDRYYKMGGGWRNEKSFGFKAPPNAKTLCQVGGVAALTLKYPRDRPLKPLAYCQLPLTKEIVCLYEGAWVAVWQQDGSFKVQRMD